jgi:hypothetical protein
VDGAGLAQWAAGLSAAAGSGAALDLTPPRLSLPGEPSAGQAARADSAE